MKNPGLIAVLATLLGAGCASHYTVTLNNGTRLSVPSKPKLEGNSYVYKDASGQPVYLPAGRVREIEPASDKPSFYNSDTSAEPSK
jgi:hypothetical protein